MLKKVVILGGGFGGVYTAMHLGRLILSEDKLEVSIINRENYMVFQPLMPEVVSAALKNSKFKKCRYLVIDAEEQ